MNNNQDFLNKIVIVTGSSSGIGEDGVISFARAGAQVVVTGKHPQQLLPIYLNNLYISTVYISTIYIFLQSISLQLLHIDFYWCTGN